MPIVLFKCILQVKVSISHHTLADNNTSLTNDKTLIFVLDPPKDDEEKKKKRRKKHDNSGVNSKNFGSRLSIDKMKSSIRFVIGWRVRLLGIFSNRFKGSVIV